MAEKIGRAMRRCKGVVAGRYLFIPSNESAAQHSITASVPNWGMWNLKHFLMIAMASASAKKTFHQDASPCAYR
jgi:hypothetical protein